MRYNIQKFTMIDMQKFDRADYFYYRKLSEYDCRENRRAKEIPAGVYPLTGILTYAISN